MPLFRAGGQLHYFAHVPKCGGSSIETYLKDRFGLLALTFQDQEPDPYRHHDQIWYKAVPQHMDAASLAELFPEGWIASSFAVVRHPFTRLASAWKYHLSLKLGRRRHPARIEWWFESQTAGGYSTLARGHNHLRPQTDLVPPDATVFRLEDGLDGVIPHIDGLAGDDAGPRALPHENRSVRPSGATREFLLPAALLKKAETYYAADFERFGYDPRQHRDEMVYDMPLTSDRRLRETRIRVRRRIKAAARSIF